MLVDLEHRGLTAAPELAIGDAARGFWAALRDVFGDTRGHPNKRLNQLLPWNWQPLGAAPATKAA